MKTRKQPLIRISNEVTKSAGVCGHYEENAFFVTIRTFERVEPAFEVSTPEEARSIANKLASEIGGRIYRGRLPASWHRALSNFPRF